MTILVLNGDSSGPINNLCVPTDAAPSYGPKGESLISVTVLGTNNDANRLLADVRQQLYEWYGDAFNDSRHLRTYSIPYGLLAQAPPALGEPTRDVRWQPGKDNHIVESLLWIVRSNIRSCRRSLIGRIHCPH